MRKKLLSEAQVRRFQSLASIKPLNEMDSSYKKHDDEDKMEEAYGDEAHMRDDETNEALYEEEDEMEMDADADADMDEADVELDEELVDQFMDAVKTIEQVADALGGAGGGEDMDMDMDMGGDDMDMDMGGEDAPMDLDAGGEDEEDDEAVLQEALRGISYVPSQKEVVKLVAKRVAKRLQEAKRAEARLNRALGKRR
tara:strand:+ start:126 stop:719 length:594 start_codon:yes stop_codon:yes gene_type:complete